MEMHVGRTFYLASTFDTQDASRGVAYRIEKAKEWACTSRWLMSEEDDNDPDAKRLGAMKCRRDIEASDEVVVLVGDYDSLGKHVEIGIALAFNKRVHLVFAPWASAGPDTMRPCAFYHLCEGPVTLEEFLS